MNAATQKDPIIDEDVASILSICKKEMRQLLGKTVMITGASGFVGGYLVETIIGLNKNAAKPCRLLLPTRNLSATRKKRPRLIDKKHVEWFEWDGRSDLEAPSGRCDYIIHAASASDPATCMKDPMGTLRSMVETTSRVLEFAREAQVSSFLCLSSGAVYGEQPSDMEAIPESYDGNLDPSENEASYGVSKLLCDLICTRSGVPLTVARLFAFIGPYQDINGSFAVSEFIRQAAFDKKIVVRGDGTAVRGYCYASDLTMILWKLLLGQNKHKVYNVGSSDHVITIGELATVVSSLMDNAKVSVMAKSAQTSRSRYVPDITRLENIHIPKVDVKTALNRTIKSYRHRRIIP